MRTLFALTLLVSTVWLGMGTGKEVVMASPTDTREQVNGGTDNEAVTDDDRRVVLGKQPLVRVGLLDGYDKIDFRIRGMFSITNLDGDTIFSSIESSRRWRCKVENSSPAKFKFSVLVATFEDEQEAEDLAVQLRARGLAARVLSHGREIVIGDKIVHEGRRRQVIVGAFDSEDQTRPLISRFSEQDEFVPRVLRHRVEDSDGTIELYDSEYDLSAIVDMGFRIVPEADDTEITVYDIRAGVGFAWEHSEDRVYRHTIEMRIDQYGHIMAINELHLDEYLRGVVPSEMHPSYPYEALKAQAVAARSYTVSKLAGRSPNEAIDFPATVHFQVYSGATREHEVTTRAVLETAGEVLKSGSRVCETYFSANSGGHTESKVNWAPPGEPYLEGVPVLKEDAAKEFTLDLSTEKDVETWLRTHPESFSNPRGTRIEMLDRNARYFRWEISYSRREIEEVIKRKLGFDIGDLIDIQPLARGVSGRITELEILGTHRNHKVFGELNIRRVLSETTLNSSCFIVDLELGDLGHPLEVTFLGAGFGHGVGMDQTAAGVMATEGMKYDEILAFFYRGAELSKIW
ncbi:SpoIID/LytB domain-containing protein [bacterium]|nr:SpoIID/LytB domain-containing protein [bacterium]